MSFQIEVGSSVTATGGTTVLDGIGGTSDGLEGGVAGGLGIPARTMRVEVTGR